MMPYSVPNQVIEILTTPHIVSILLINSNWLISDFFLFHHLFRDTAKEQHWMMYTKPADLIKIYDHYAHGDPRSAERRVVLDESMLDDVADVLVLPGEKLLLESFLAHVADAAERTKGTDRPILLLVFGPGNETTFSITIRGDKVFDKCPVLRQDNLKAALLHNNPNPNASMMTTLATGVDGSKPLS